MKDPQLYYCYCIQAWIENGIIAECGHPEGFEPPCTACQCAGQGHRCQDCITWNLERGRERGTA